MRHAQAQFLSQSIISSPHFYSAKGATMFMLLVRKFPNLTLQHLENRCISMVTRNKFHTLSHKYRAPSYKTAFMTTWHSGFVHLWLICPNMYNVTTRASPTVRTLHSPSFALLHSTAHIWAQFYCNIQICPPPPRLTLLSLFLCLFPPPPHFSSLIFLLHSQGFSLSSAFGFSPSI